MTLVQAQNVTGDSPSADIHLDSAGRWPGTPSGLQLWPPCGPSFQLRCPRIHQGQQEACPGDPVPPALVPPAAQGRLSLMVGWGSLGSVIRGLCCQGQGLSRVWHPGQLYCQGHGT